MISGDVPAQPRWQNVRLSVCRPRPSVYLSVCRPEPSVCQSSSPVYTHSWSSRKAQFLIWQQLLDFITLLVFCLCCWKYGAIWYVKQLYAPCISLKLVYTLRISWFMYKVWETNRECYWYYRVLVTNWTVFWTNNSLLWNMGYIIGTV